MEMPDHFRYIIPGVEKYIPAERYYNNWNGEGLPEGVYYYSFTLKSCPVKKGWVQIMR